MPHGRKMILEAVFQPLLVAYTPPLRIIKEGAAPRFTPRNYYFSFSKRGSAMRCVVQRVIESSVSVNGNIVGSIGKGLMVLLGVKSGDTEKDAEYIAGKILKLRIFEDENGKMNRSVVDIGGQVLCISQFTLLGDARGQNRPGFTLAEAPERANELYEYTCNCMKNAGMHVEKGIFRADMKVHLINDGPVTILLDSEKNF